MTTRYASELNEGAMFENVLGTQVEVREVTNDKVTFRFHYGKKIGTSTMPRKAFVSLYSPVDKP